MEIPTEWVVSIAVAFVTLAGTIWAYIKSQHTAIISRVDNQAQRLEGKLDQCETRHLERDKTFHDLTLQVGELKGMNEVADKFERVVKDALLEVKNS